MIPSQAQINLIRLKRVPQTRKPTTQTASVSNGNIQYILSDLLNPNLVKTVPPPKAPFPPISVKEYRGGGFVRGSAQSVAANAYVTVSNVLTYTNQQLGNAVRAWPGIYSLVVRPLAGIDLNAFYDRRSLQFFYYTNSRIGGTLYTADSADVVSHELGHAIMDSLRPQTWSAMYIEVWAMHEAFGDITALLNSMNQIELVNYALEQTGGDLRKHSILCNIGEAIGRALAIMYPSEGLTGEFLRSVLNNFVYVNPRTLPYDGPDNILTYSPHSFSRIFSGALYELIVEIYEHTVGQGYPVLDSLRHSRNQVAQYFMRAIQYAPINSKYYESVAKTMMWYDSAYNAKHYQHLLRKVFVRRGIISPEFVTLAAQDTEPVMIRSKSRLDCKLNLVIPNNNPLSNFQIEMPHEKGYIYDSNGSLTDEIVVSKAEAVDDAASLLNYLNAKGKVDSTPKTPFEIKNGKIVRTHFS